MSRSFLFVISLLCAGGVAASRLHSSPAFVTSSVSINPYEIQATIKGLPEQQFADLV